jgi:hypothetical protein
MKKSPEILELVKFVFSQLIHNVTSNLFIKKWYLCNIEIERRGEKEEEESGE